MSGLTEGLKGFVNERDIVALLGLHNAGSLNQQNSGFQGSWGQGTSDRNAINTGMYSFMLGWKKGRNFNMEQTHSYEHNNGTSP